MNKQNLIIGFDLQYNIQTINKIPGQMADLDFNIQLDHNGAQGVGDAQRAKKQLNYGSKSSTPSGTGYNKSYSQQDELQINSGNYNLKNAAHPFACIATIAFKGMALFFYLFVGMFAPNVITFIIVMIMSALDFWTVKNVTGRLLVGLRWWSDYDEKGEEIWKFQSFDKEYRSNSADKAFFWTGQLASTATWAVFLIIKVLSLSPFWALLNLINFGLSGTNLYGYYKCRGDHNKKLKSLKIQGLNRLAGRILG